MNFHKSRIFPILFLILGPLQMALAIDNCGRVATVNYQKIFIDTSSTKKGEGLRYYIDKDPVAKSYLDEYQEKGKPRWYHAAIGTLGTGLIIAGISQSGSFNDEGLTSKKNLFITGAFMLTLNVLIFRTLEHNNERLLMNAIEEYNKRNLPKIYFSPLPLDNTKEWKNEGPGLTLGLVKEF